MFEIPKFNLQVGVDVFSDILEFSGKQKDHLVA